MSIETNKAVAIALVESVGRGALDRSLMTDDAVWWSLGRGAFPIDAFLQMVRGFIETSFAGEGELTIRAVTAEDDRVAVEAEIAFPLVKGGSYRNEYHFLIRFRDGKACEVREYYDAARSAEGE